MLNQVFSKNCLCPGGLISVFMFLLHHSCDGTKLYYTVYSLLESLVCIIYTLYSCVCVSAALLFSPLESALARGRGVEDSLNSVAAAAVTGVLYRSTG